LFTDKLRLGFTIRLGNIATSATSARSVLWVDKDNRHSSQLRFVEDKISEFAKRPFAKSLSLLFINRCPKALEVFECNSSFGVFSFKNNLLGNGVVYMPFESSFSARELFQMSFGGLSAFMLESLFKAIHLHSNLINSHTRESFSIRSSGKVDDTHINAKIAFGFDWCSVRQLYAEAKKKVAFLIDKVSLTSYSSYSSHLFGRVWRKIQRR